MLHIANYQGNINQNHNEMSPHTCQKGCHQKEQMINVGEDTEEALLVNTCVLSNAGIRKNSCKILCPFSSVQSLSHVLLFATPWTAARQASLSFTISRSCSNSYPSSQWCHPTISSSVVSFFSCLQSFPASGYFPTSQFFSPGGQRSYILSLKPPKQQIYNERDMGLGGRC